MRELVVEAELVTVMVRVTVTICGGSVEVDEDEELLEVVLLVEEVRCRGRHGGISRDGRRRGTWGRCQRSRICLHTSDLEARVPRNAATSARIVGTIGIPILARRRVIPHTFGRSGSSPHRPVRYLAQLYTSIPSHSSYLDD